MTTINQRIKDVIRRFYDGNATAFARSVDIGPSTIHSIIGKKQSIPTFTVISLIYKTLRDEGLSSSWLLSGEGKITTNTKSDIKSEITYDRNPLNIQEGGNHYKGCKIQPIEYITANNLDFMQGNIVKYITRHKNKNGAEDIRKIKHYCDLILKLQYNE